MIPVRDTGPAIRQSPVPRALGIVTPEPKVPEGVLEEPAAVRALWAAVLHSGATLCIVE